MSTRHIHIVEDDDAVRASMAALMGLRANVTIHSYKSGTAFLADTDRLDRGVVLLDFRMPGVSGMELLAALKDHPHHFVTIMLTGHADIALAIRAMKLGAFDFVEKPVSAERLTGAVDSALALLDASEVAHVRSARARRLVATLSPRERDVLIGLIDGQPNKVIAHALGISPRTIEIHRARLMEKMGVGSLSEMLRIAFDAGLLEPSLAPGRESPLARSFAARVTSPTAVSAITIRASIPTPPTSPQATASA